MSVESAPAAAEKVAVAGCGQFHSGAFSALQRSPPTSRVRGCWLKLCRSSPRGDTATRLASGKPGGSKKALPPTKQASELLRSDRPTRSGARDRGRRAPLPDQSGTPHLGAGLRAAAAACFGVLTAPVDGWEPTFSFRPEDVAAGIGSKSTSVTPIGPGFWRPRAHPRRHR